MSPEAARFLEKARSLLAAFHAAQALILERTGKVLKTHQGVHAEFLRLTRNDRRIDPALRGFLSQA